MSNIHNGMSLDEALENLPLTGMPLRVAIIMAIVLVADGFDLILLGYVAPAVTADFGLSHNGLGIVLTGSLIGVAAGSFFGGTLGDHFGRRNTVIFSLLLFGVATLASAYTHDIYLFTFARLLVGFGLGAASPNAATLMAEVMPSRWRSQTITLAHTCTSLGAVVAGILSQQLLPSIGWRGLFVIGAVVPVLVCIFLMPLIPESPRFLARQPGGAAKAARALNRLIGKPIYSGNDALVPADNKVVKEGMGALLNKDFRRDTLSLAIMIFMILFAWVAIGNWGTTVITSLGYELSSAVAVMVCYNVAGLVGAVTTAFLIRRLGSRLIFTVLATATMLATALLIVAFQLGYVSIFWITGYVIIAGAGLTAINLACYPVATHVYPTAIRATGVGAVFGFGRLGAVCSSAVMAVLIGAGGAPLFFAGVAAAALGALICIRLLARHIPKMNNVPRSAS